MVWALSQALGPWAHSSSPLGIVVHVDKTDSFKGIQNQVTSQIAFIFKVVNIWSGDM